jgi:hypothetical protein
VRIGSRRKPVIAEIPLLGPFDDFSLADIVFGSSTGKLATRLGVSISMGPSKSAHSTK